MTTKISELLSDVKECALPLEEPSSSSWGKIQKLTFDKITGAQAAPAPRRHGRRIAILAAAALLSVCVTVTAAASGALSSVGDLFAAGFGGQPDQIELIEQLGQPLGQTDSRNGITISADAILSDGKYFVVLFTVSRDNGEPLIPADVQPGGKLYFGCCGTTDTEEYPIHFARNSSGFVNGAPGDLSAQFLCYYEAPNGLPSTFQPDFNNLGYWLDGGAQIVKLYERAFDPNDDNADVWRFELPLLTGKVVEPMPIDNEPFSANGEEFAVTGLRVSPLAVTVDYEATSTTPSVHASNINWYSSDGTKFSIPDCEDDYRAFEENMTLLLRKKDGTEIDLSTYVNDLGNTRSMFTITPDWEQDKYLCRYGGVLPEIVPLEDMDCVIFNGLEYPVG